MLGTVAVCWGTRVWPWGPLIMDGCRSWLKRGWDMATLERTWQDRGGRGVVGDGCLCQLQPVEGELSLAAGPAGGWRAKEAAGSGY